MALAKVYSRATMGIDAPLVTVETHLSSGLPSLSIVGLPETTVRESKERVRSALINCGFSFPARRITINLAPADLPKEGSRYDLPIAIGILAASEQIVDKKLSNTELLGELALDGTLRGISGVLPATLQSAKNNKQLIVPAENSEEASLADHSNLFAAENLKQLCEHLQGFANLQKVPGANQNLFFTPAKNSELADVAGQQQAKRALEIAACGRHNLLLFGPPGTGKTMIASKLPGILPSLSREKSLEIAALYSISKQQKLCFNRPFRSPHHTASSVALVGGGGKPRPGEISLAHHGVLFLDELPEFDRKVLEVMREPLESGVIHISRANHQVSYPANFQLIAAMNPCPCGYFGDKEKACRCTPDQILRYRHRISGPLLDRIDMQIEMAREPFLFENQKSSEKILSHELSADHTSKPCNTNAESSATVQARVEKAYQQQLARQQKSNAELDHKEIKQHCSLNKTQQQLLQGAVKQFALSARAAQRILKVARSIADLAEQDAIQDAHLMEALAYRQLEKSSGSL